MIDFRDVPGSDLARPLLDVYLDRELLIPQTCLLDTGAAGVRLSADLAIAAGIAVPDQPTGRDLVIGGVRSQVYAAEHRLAVDLGGEVLHWTAPVSFCAPWPHPFGLLGLEGFFDVFDVLVQAADRRFEIRRRG